MKQQEIKELQRIIQRLLKFTLSEAEVEEMDNEQQLFGERISQQAKRSLSREPEELTKLALQEIERRKLRQLYLPEELFSEGGWNILLDLFVADLCAENVSISSACIASNLPPSTALRWIKLLEDHALLERHADWTDRRRFFVRLSAQAKSAMTKLLCQMSAIEQSADRLAKKRFSKTYQN